MHGNAFLLFVPELGVARITQHDLVEGLGEIRLRDRLGAAPRGVQGGFVHQVGQVGARKTGRVLGDGIEVDVGGERFVFGVDLEDGTPRTELGPIDDDAAIESPRAQQRWVQDVRPVGGRHYDGEIIAIETCSSRVELSIAVHVPLVAVAVYSNPWRGEKSPSNRRTRVKSKAIMLWFRRRRRKKVRARPFPAPWAAIIDGNVPYVRLLTEPDRHELHGHILVFLNEKRFEGCGGVVITDEIRVTIAAQACILLLHRETDYYPLLQTILVYPTAYAAKVTRRRGDLEEEATQVRLGESWYRGAVVLSWDDVKWGAADVDDGANVVLHEFAHQLDDEFGHADGAPKLRDRSMYVAWARVLGHEYAALSRRIATNKRSVIDDYGAENPAEFFAVVTEAFFEKPLALRRHHPQLYEQLQLFYQQDPALRKPPPAPPAMPTHRPHRGAKAGSR